MGAEAENALPGLRNWEEARMNTGSSDFEALFMEYYPRLVCLLTRLVGSREQAEELADDAFWCLFRRHMVREPGFNIGGWLYKTATNLGLNALRAAARRRKYETTAGQGGLQIAPDPLQQAMRSEDHRQVRLVLSRMKPRDAQILLLREYGCSYDEIARVAEVKRTSVGTLLARAEHAFNIGYTTLFVGHSPLGRETDL
jgi:RNA polymerase sigma-70 factor (ECF subfamily)